MISRSRSYSLTILALILLGFVSATAPELSGVSADHDRSANSAASGVAARSIGSALRFLNPEADEDADLSFYGIESDNLITYTLGEYEIEIPFERFIQVGGGFPPYSYSSKVLPLVLNTLPEDAQDPLPRLDGAGRFVGTFPAGSSLDDPFAFDVTVTDASGKSITGVFSMNETAGGFKFALNEVLPIAQKGLSYACRLDLTGYEIVRSNNGVMLSNPPLVGLVAGSLGSGQTLEELGLTLNRDGMLFGRPLQAGTITFSVYAVVEEDGTAVLAANFEGDDALQQEYTLEVENVDEVNSQFYATSSVVNGRLNPNAGVDSLALSGVFNMNGTVLANLAGETLTIRVGGGRNINEFSFPGIEDEFFDPDDPESSSTFRVNRPYGSTYNVRLDGKGQGRGGAPLPQERAFRLIATNDDIPPRIYIDDVTFYEGSEVEESFLVSLSNASKQPVSVNFRVRSKGAREGQDFTIERDSTITFAPGQTVARIPVTVIEDGLIEKDEFFEIELFNPKGAAIEDGIGVGTIVDLDSVLAGVDRDDVEGDDLRLIRPGPVQVSARIANDGRFNVKLAKTDLSTSVGSVTLRQRPAANLIVQLSIGPLLVSEVIQTAAKVTRNPYRLRYLMNKTGQPLAGVFQVRNVSSSDFGQFDGNRGSRYSMTFTAYPFVGPTTELPDLKAGNGLQGTGSVTLRIGRAYDSEKGADHNNRYYEEDVALKTDRPKLSISLADKKGEEFKVYEFFYLSKRSTGFFRTYTIRDDQSGIPQARNAAVPQLVLLEIEGGGLTGKSTRVLFADKGKYSELP